MITAADALSPILDSRAALPYRWGEIMKWSWEQLKAKANFVPRSLALEMCVGLSLRVPGHIVEFGVAGGHSTRAIRDALRRARETSADAPHADKAIFACDSFDGLPEPYEALEAGHFACQPPVIDGVEIVVGHFEDTLTPQLAKRIGRVCFAHLDADLYSSTARALRFLTPMLDTGSLLLFDEFTGGEGAEQRAFEEWRRATGVATQLVAEFARAPSGGGATIDRRVVYQVVAAADLQPAAVPGGLSFAGVLQVDHVTAPDIVPGDAPVRLGSNWYPLETYAGEAFRWVENDAELLSDQPQTLALELEPGPGLAGAFFSLELRRRDGARVRSVRVDGRRTVEVVVEAGAYLLHVEGGGRSCPGDWRTLNFRIFRIQALGERCVR